MTVDAVVILSNQTRLGCFSPELPTTTQHLLSGHLAPAYMESKDALLVMKSMKVFLCH